MTKVKKIALTEENLELVSGGVDFKKATMVIAGIAAIVASDVLAVKNKDKIKDAATNVKNYFKRKDAEMYEN